MSRKINYKSISPFHDRLHSIIGDDVQEWAKKLNVTPSTISNRWYKGSYPTADKLIKLVELSKVSSEWLLEGKETTGHCILPPGSDEFCNMLKEILTQSSDKQVTIALRTNLVAFKNSIEKDFKNSSQDKRIKRLEREHADLKKQMAFFNELYDRKTKSDT